MTKRRNKVTSRKWMGNDLYSWAVFVDDKPVVTGLSKSEAAYHHRQIVELYKAKAGR